MAANSTASIAFRRAGGKDFNPGVLQLLGRPTCEQIPPKPPISQDSTHIHLS